MLFSEAIQALVEGKFVVRESWPIEQGYLAYLPGMPHAWKVLTQPGPNAGNHLFYMDEMLATDWKVVERNFFVKNEESIEIDDQVAE